jgi:putative ABC transport system ATP-binding protein
MSASDGVLVRVKDVEKTFHRGSEEIHVLSGLSLEVPKAIFWP